MAVFLVFVVVSVLRAVQGITWNAGFEEFGSASEWIGNGAECGETSCSRTLGEAFIAQLTGTNGDGTNENYCQSGFKSMCAPNQPEWGNPPVYRWEGVAPQCPGKNRGERCPSGYTYVARDKSGDSTWCSKGQKALCVRFGGRRRLGQEQKALQREARVAEWYDNGKVLVIGDVVLGVTESATLNCPYDLSQGTTYEGGFTFPVNDQAGFGVVGIRPKSNLLAHSCEPGRPSEGWGAFLEDTSGNEFNVWGNPDYGRPDGASESFTFASDGSQATSVWVDEGSSPALRVTHDFHASASSQAVEVSVTIENAGSNTANTVRYRRVVDWDIFGNQYSEYVTLVANGAGDVLSTSNDGFAKTDIQDHSSLKWRGKKNIYFNKDFVREGPLDQGAAFDFEFAALNAGDSFTFQLYYGYGNSEAEAQDILRALEAEVYTIGMADQTDFRDKLCFFMAFTGVGGTPALTKAPTPETVAPSKSPTKAPTKGPTVSPTKNPTLSPSASPTRAPTFENVFSRFEFGLSYDCASETDFSFDAGRRTSWALVVADLLSYTGDPRSIEIIASELPLLDDTGETIPEDYLRFGINTVVDFASEAQADAAEAIVAGGTFQDTLFATLRSEYSQSWPECDSTFVDGKTQVPPGAGNALTQAPSEPLSAFTVSPSKAPSKSPTKSPTKGPTKSPTKAPTKSPTGSPTPSPTDEPTLSPTKSPSKSPTASPTGNPSSSPTQNPTAPVCNKPYVAISVDQSSCGKKKKTSGGSSGSGSGSQGPYECGVVEFPNLVTVTSTRKEKKAKLNINSCCSGWNAGDIVFSREQGGDPLDVAITLQAEYELLEARIGYGNSTDYYTIVPQDNPQPVDDTATNWVYEFSFDDSVADKADKSLVLIKVCVKDQYTEPPINTQNTLAFEEDAAQRNAFVALILAGAAALAACIA